MVRCSAICFVLFVGMIPCAPAQAPAAPASPAAGTPATPAANGAPTTPAEAGAPAAPAAAATPAPPPTADNGLKTYTVPSGTKLLLSLKHEISTRAAQPGDAVYLVAEFPVVEDGAVVIPAGMYVKGVIDSIQRPGRVKGRAQLQLHLTSMIFPNGVEIAIPGALDNVPGSTGAKVKNSEGTVEQGSSTGHDAQRIADNSLEGAGVGGLVGFGTGDVARGTGIGAGAGAAVGVLTTLLTRGNDIVFPPGMTLEMTLTRPLIVQQAQLGGMPSYTGMTLPAPGAAQQLRAASPKPNN